MTAQQGTSGRGRRAVTRDTEQAEATSTIGTLLRQERRE
jgi:hypothetical protein